MSKPLPFDITRCYGQGCDQKETCRRFLSINLDKQYHGDGDTRWVSYVDTLVDALGYTCEAKIDG